MFDKVAQTLSEQGAFKFTSLHCVHNIQNYHVPCIMCKQEAHGPQVAHLSDIATADMQMLCNIFPVLSSQLMKRSTKQFLILKKNIIYGMTVNGA